MSRQQDVDLVFSVVHRSLSEPIYFIRFAKILLTEFDFFFVLIVTVLVWILIDITGVGHYRIWIISVDPFAYVLLGLLLVVIISVLHRVRPEGNIEQILMGVLAPKRYVPRKTEGDKFWSPSQRAHITWGLTKRARHKR